MNRDVRVARETQEDELYADMGRRLSAAIARSRRSNLWTLRASILLDWPAGAYQHFVETGEEPVGKEFGS